MITKEQYQVAMERISELVKVVDNYTPTTDRNYIELMMLSDLVEEYENIHYSIKTPSLVDIIKLRMYEMKLTQKAVSELIGVSPLMVNKYLTGKSEPTLRVARNISKKLNISADVVLGV